MSKAKTIEGMIGSQNQVTNLCISAAAGGLVGITAALLLAPKTGQKLRKQILRTYEDLSEKGQELADDFLEKGQDAVCKVTGYAGNIKDTAANLMNKRSSDNHGSHAAHLVIGAVGGGVLGAMTALLLSHREEEEVVEGLAHRIKEAGKAARNNIKSVDWIETAKDFVDTVRSKIHHGNGSEIHEEAEEHHGIHDALEWATLGFRLWQNIKKKR